MNLGARTRSVRCKVHFNRLPEAVVESSVTGSELYSTRRAINWGLLRVPILIQRSLERVNSTAQFENSPDVVPPSKQEKVSC